MQVLPLRIPTSVYTFSSCGLVAQWIERLPPEQKVVGSNPIKPTFDFLLSILSLTSTFRLSRVGGINYSRLEGLGLCIAPNARNFSGVCGRFGRAPHHVPRAPHHAPSTTSTNAPRTHCSLRNIILNI